MKSSGTTRIHLRSVAEDMKVVSRLFPDSQNHYGAGMQLHLDRVNGINFISAVGPGEVRIGDRIFQDSIIVSAHEIVPDWTVTTIDEIDERSIAPILAMEPEIILLGTGDSVRFPDRRLMAGILARRIGLEVMDTAAACRTFNILVGEDRQVAAALLMG